jgi:hypothetical protein
MEDKTSTFTSTQKTNNLPDFTKNSGYFGKSSASITPIPKQENLTNPVTEKQVSPVDMVSINTAKNNMQPISQPNMLVKEEKDSEQYLPGLNKSGILQSNVTKENLIKTESISKTNLSISEIQNKNKEIMVLDERIKQFPSSQSAKQQNSPTVINNYGNGGNGGSKDSGPARSDPLAGIRNTMRAYPSWRTEMG